MSHSIYAVIKRLWRDAPKMTDANGDVDPTQAPAVACHVLLKGQQQPLHGALSQTPEGPLRMLTPAKVNGKDVLLESFFEVEEVQSVMVERPVAPAQSSGLIIGS